MSHARERLRWATALVTAAVTAVMLTLLAPHSSAHADPGSPAVGPRSSPDRPDPAGATLVSSGR